MKPILNDSSQTVKQKTTGLPLLPPGEADPTRYGPKDHPEPLSLNNGQNNSIPPSSLPIGQPLPINMWSALQKRDLLRSALSVYKQEHFSTSHWDYVSVMTDTYIEEEKITDTDFRPYRKHNLTHCYTEQNRSGKVYASPEGEQLYFSRLHCSERYCLLCSDRSAKRSAKDKIEQLKGLVRSQPGFKGLLSVVFTLPQEIEGSISKDTSKALMDHIQGTMREVFGLGSKANLSLIISQHAIGSKNVFRDRYHYHVTVIPCYTDKDKEFQWVEPKIVSEKHTADMWKLDLKYLRSAWKRILEKVFTFQADSVANPQVSWLPYPKPEGEPQLYYWLKRLPGKDVDYIEGFWQSVSHGMKYSLRGFSQDFSNVVLRTNKRDRTFIVKASDADHEWWVCITASEFFKRFKHVVDHTISRQRGMNLKKWIEPEPETEEPETLPPVRAEVIQVREKVYDKKKGVIWKRDSIYRFVHPVTLSIWELSVKDHRSIFLPWLWKDRRK